MNARISAGSLTPLLRSTPDDTSTAGAPVCRMAAPTVSDVRPPASIQGPGAVQPLITDQSNVIALPPGRLAPAGAFASSTSRSAGWSAGGRSDGPLTPMARQIG